MAIGVELPALGESVVEGTVARWLVKRGSGWSATSLSWRSRQIKWTPKSRPRRRACSRRSWWPRARPCPWGPIARIEPGVGASLAAPAAAPSKPARAESPESPRTASPGVRPEPASPQEPRATPVAKRMAEDARVDLAGVEGTGAAGRVTKRDVQQRSAEAPAPRTPARPAAAREAAPGANRPAFLS